MTKEAKLQVLARIARLLNEEEILWAVGGSALLYLKGIVSDFHDLDLMIDEHAEKQVRNLLAKIGTLHSATSSAQFHSRCFMEWTVDGAEIDIIGGLVIESEGHAYAFPLKPEEIEDYIQLEGEIIPLHSLTCWEQYYTLMGRTEKAEILRRVRSSRKSIPTQ
ncbi:nucleotidyltransferase domain-containing protein [Holdemania massiliensis]|uniref:nucleotidyltransferase domain-containing protein n=1 Tax=Holdemania massiliensis TaxID=1468449 RepID=UPI001F05AF94|nr:hypothetical protein [Holdemania massiliensis]MCH1939938.1 hypothetical protein [Holdemania massiliensis]